MPSGTEIAKAYVQIIPSAEGIKGKLTSLLGGEAKSAGKSAGETAGANIAGAIKKAIAAAGIGKVIKDALSEGADLQQSLGGIETLFKYDADTVKKYASEAYKTAGLSANSYMEQVTSFSASLLQSLGGDTAKAAESANAAIIAMADNANKMGTDMSSIQNAYQGFAKQNYTMLDNLKLGYGGTKQEMERLLEDAEALSGVHYDIENLNDVYSAIQVIQDSLGITGTTAKEAAETFSGSLASMKAAAQNLLGNLALGKDIAPSLQELMETIKTFVGGNLIPMLGNILKSALDVNVLLQIPQIAEDAIAGLKNIVEKIVAALPMAIQNLASALIDTADVLIEGAADLLIQMATAMVDNIGLFVDVAIRVVTAIADSLVENVSKLTEAAPELLEKLMASLSENVPKVVRVALQLLATLAEALAKNIETIIPLLTETITAIVEVLSEMLSDTETLKSLVNAAAHIIAAIIVGVIEALPDLLMAAVDLVNALGKALIDAIPILAEAAFKLVLCIGEALLDLVASAGGWGKDLIQNFIDGIKERFHALIDAIKEIAQTVKDLLGFSEPKIGPLSNFHTYAPDMMELFAQGIRQNADLVTDQVDRAFDIGSRISDYAVSGVGAPAPRREASNDMTSSGGGSINIAASYGASDNQLIRLLAPKLEAYWARRGATI